MDELVHAARPCMRPERLYHTGVNMHGGGIEDHQAVDTSDVAKLMRRGARYLISSSLRHKAQTSIIEARGHRHTKKYRWVRKPDKRCEQCNNLLEDEPITKRRYCDRCRSQLASPRKIPKYTCIGCGEQYQPRDRRQKHCSRECAYLHRPTPGRGAKRS